MSSIEIMATLDLTEVEESVFRQEAFRRRLIGRATLNGDAAEAGELENVELLARIEDADFFREASRRGENIGIDIEALETARSYLVRGNRCEALIYLERALGGEFVGRLTTFEQTAPAAS